MYVGRRYLCTYEQKANECLALAVPKSPAQDLADCDFIKIVDLAPDVHAGERKGARGTAKGGVVSTKLSFQSEATGCKPGLR